MTGINESTFATLTISPAPKAETGVTMKRRTTPMPSHNEVLRDIVTIAIERDSSYTRSKFRVREFRFL
jgi:hypothetical protein